jgi:hypothetical protein
MLREVGGQCGGFAVVEDSETYKMGFAKSYQGKLTQFRLYRVCSWNPKTATYFAPVYILADNAESAASQATCHNGIEYTNWDYAQKEQAEKNSRIEEVPFGIRGWSGHKF